MSRMLQALKNLDAKTTPHEEQPPLAVAVPVETAPVAAAPADAASNSPILRALQAHTFSAGSNFERNFDWLQGAVDVQETSSPQWDAVVEVPPLPPPASAVQEAKPTAATAIVEVSNPQEAVIPVTKVRPVLRAEATALERAARKNLSDVERCGPYRQLVDRLRQEFRSLNGSCLLFTGIGISSSADELLIHTAMALAEAGEPILLIDADVARGKLSRALGSEKLPGLAEVVSQRRQWQELLQGTATERLFLLPAGQLGLANPAAAADETAKLLEQAEREFGIVLIDGGGAGDLLALTLGRLCDATYFVVRLGATDAIEAREALRRYRSLGARVLGCIATNVQTA